MRQLDITLEVNYISFCHYIFHLIRCGVRWVETAGSMRHENQEPQVQGHPVGVETLMAMHDCVPGTDLPKKRQVCYLTEA